MITWRHIYRQVDASASHGDHAESTARRALLSGMLVSSLLLLAGLLLVLLRNEPRPDETPRPAELFGEFKAFRGVAFVYLGLLTLAFTPILRVIVMVGIYLKRQEWFMFVVSLVVLSLLAIGLVWGAG